jgi:hypothetical protein
MVESSLAFVLLQKKKNSQKREREILKTGGSNKA